MKDAESIAVEGHRFPMALEIAPGGAEVVERGLDRGEGKFHEPARGVVDVSLAHERQRLLAGRGGQLAIAGPPAMAGRQGRGAVAPERAVQAADLALAQPEQRGRPAPGQPPLRQLGHDLQPIQFPHRQRHRLRHGAIVSAGRTFLLWRNRTFALWAYRSTSDKVRYVNFWGSGSVWRNHRTI